MSKPIKITVFFLLILTFQLSTDFCFAQKKKSMSVKDKLKTADRLLQEGIYYSAIDFYKEVAEEQSDNDYVANQLAETYFTTRDYKNAEAWYKKVITIDATKYPKAQYKYAMSLKMQGKYEAAKTEFTAAVKKLEDTPIDGINYKKMAKSEISACEFAMKEIKNPKPVRIKNAGSDINAAYSEFAPIPNGEDLYYSSFRSDTVISFDDKTKEKFLTQIYKVKREGSSFSGKIPLPPVINDGENHNGNGTFSLNVKKFYFTRCTSAADNPNKLTCSIYVSELKNDEWQAPSALPKEINDPGSTTTQPAIGVDKTGKEVLYFVSDRKEGGQGGKDIWYSVIGKDGFTPPKNLGKKINTSGDEATPFYDRKFKIFYFSSNGHPGLGGYDIFKSEGNLKKMTSPENLGFPINSSVDDMYFVADESGRGYLTSNRIGSMSLKSETCCDDIFVFEWIDKINVAVKGYVFEVGDSTHKPIEGATVSLYSIDKEANENVVMANIVTEKDKMYFFDLLPDKEYRLSASKKGFFSGKGLFLEYADISTKNITKSDTLIADLYLQRMKQNVGYVIKNIYYDFDKATLRSESVSSLDSMLMLLNEHPEIKVELGSHTDSKGTDDYNIKLSQKRAESVVSYLIQKGIPANRLVAKGYGETQPVALNENADKSDNPEGRQLNRRTEFKIIGEVPVTVLEEEIPEEMKIKNK